MATAVSLDLIRLARDILYSADEPMALTHTELLDEVAMMATTKREQRDDDATNVTIYVYSYGISCTAGLLRHVYLCVNDVELHAGMTADNSRQLVYSTQHHYGVGRCEGYMVMCTSCANDLMDDVRAKCERFFLPITNCDTIVPVGMQTSLIWLSLIGLLIGGVVGARAQNFFTFALFVPLLAFLVTLLYNRFAVSSNPIDGASLLSRCSHASSSRKPNDNGDDRSPPPSPLISTNVKSLFDAAHSLVVWRRR